MCDATKLYCVLPLPSVPDAGVGASVGDVVELFF